MQVADDGEPWADREVEAGANPDDEVIEVTAGKKRSLQEQQKAC